jgi:hypothetical protein
VHSARGVRPDDCLKIIELGLTPGEPRYGREVLRRIAIENLDRGYDAYFSFSASSMSWRWYSFQ